MSESTRAMAARLERLERTQRRLVRFGGGALGLVCLGWMASMMPVCKTVWAERFVLRDARGKERAVLTAYETGGIPKFTLHDPRGGTLANLSVDAEGEAFLELFDAEGERSTRFSAAGENGAGAGRGAEKKPAEGTPDRVGMAR